MIIFRLSGLFLIMLLIVSCASTPGEEFTASNIQEAEAKEILLSVGEKASFKNSSIEFLDIVNDSRCPKGVKCVTEGAATLSYIYSTPTSAESFELNTSDASVQQFDDVKVTLVSFAPLPSEGSILSPEEFTARIIVTEAEVLEDVVIIDVRTEEEYNNSHYSGAINIPVDDISDRISELSLAKDDTFIVYCRSGNRAGKAKTALEELGYINVLNGVNEDSLSKLLD